MKTLHSCHEEALTIASGIWQLQAYLGYPDEGEPHGAVLLLSPHPSLGGDFDNNVIVTLARTLAAAGWLTLRFNYRGVGESTGPFGLMERIANFDENDRRDPESQDDLDDALHAYRYLDSLNADGRPLHVAGYSYGATLANALREKQVIARGKTTLISMPEPPSCDVPQQADNDLTMIYAQDDFVLDAARVGAWTAIAKGQIITIPETDHFYLGCEQQLAALIESLLR